MLTDCLRERIRDAMNALERLDALLDQADRLPGLLLATVAVEVDHAASLLVAAANRLGQQPVGALTAELGTPEAQEPHRYTKKGADQGRWVQIGTHVGEDGKRHGGSPVYIESGRITKGHPSLTGRKIDALKEEPEPSSHRQELRQSREHARAVWAKKARREGIDPQDLRQLAAELLAHDKAFTDERTALLKRARRMSEGLGYGSLDSLAARARQGKIDASHVRGLDDVAARLAEEFPGFSGGMDQLFDQLVHGNPVPLSEDEAFDHLAEMRQQQADEPVPFARRGSVERYGRESDAPPGPGFWFKTMAGGWSKRLGD